MAQGEVAAAATRAISQYLIVRQSQGASTTYDAQLEGLVGLVEAHFSEPYLAEVFFRFKARPNGATEADAFKLHLTAELEKDVEFRAQLSSAMGGKVVRRASRRVAIIGASVVVVLVLISAFLLGRSSLDGQSGLGPSVSPVTAPTSSHGRSSTATASVSSTSTGSPSSSTSASGATSSTTSGVAGVAVPGDGGSLEKGKSVYLTDLPRPNDEWSFEHGMHDVQFVQLPNSLWSSLTTCSERQRSGWQQFRLKNFSRLEVKAVGADSTSDTNLTYRFEVFVNDDNVNPIAAEVVGSGESKELKVDLPAGVFALTLRSSLDQLSGSSCRAAKAVWGAPYVIASGR